MTYDDRAKEANKLRQAEIKQLRACLCLYPLERYRNGSGHGGACPVHLAYVERKSND